MNELPKVSEEYIARKKQRIVNAAYQLCLRKTVSTVTMQDIINETGLSQGGIYRFYRDIDEIFSAMVKEMRERASIKEKVDTILAQTDLPPAKVTEQIFTMLADFMKSELMGVEKIDFEFSVLAMNEPERADKIMKNISGIGNMEYLTMRTMDYVRQQTEQGKLHPKVSAEELLSYIASAYSGIQMQCIVANCYQSENNPLSQLFQPEMQLNTLAKTVNFLLGET